MTAQVNPAKLAQLDQITLSRSSHTSFDDGHCAMEVVAWLADLGHTDAPPCASPVLTRFVIRLNDRWDSKQRQKLKPFLPRLVGTSSDGKDDLREQVVTRYAADLLVPWLRLAGLDSEVEKIRAATPDDLAQILRVVREAAWSARRTARDKLVAKVQEKLKDQPAVAAAVAAAAAAAVAVAAAVAAAAAAGYWPSYNSAYDAARTYYREHPLPVRQQIADLAADQDGAALDLLDRLIDPEAA